VVFLSKYRANIVGVSEQKDKQEVCQEMKSNDKQEVCQDMKRDEA
jgi:recombinational DNA repair protein RecR